MAYLAMVLGDPSPPGPSLLTPLQAAQRRLALGLGLGLALGWRGEFGQWRIGNGEENGEENG